MDMYWLLAIGFAGIASRIVGPCPIWIIVLSFASVIGFHIFK